MRQHLPQAKCRMNQCVPTAVRQSQGEVSTDRRASKTGGEDSTGGRRGLQVGHVDAQWREAKAETKEFFLQPGWHACAAAVPKSRGSRHPEVQRDPKGVGLHCYVKLGHNNRKQWSHYSKDDGRGRTGGHMKCHLPTRTTNCPKECKKLFVMSEERGHIIWK